VSNTRESFHQICGIMRTAAYGANFAVGLG
jgi:hypothetical protein